MCKLDSVSILSAKVTTKTVLRWAGSWGQGWVGRLCFFFLFFKKVGHLVKIVQFTICSSMVQTRKQPKFCSSRRSPFLTHKKLNTYFLPHNFTNNPKFDIIIFAKENYKKQNKKICGIDHFQVGRACGTSFSYPVA